MKFKEVREEWWLGYDVGRADITVFRSSELIRCHIAPYFDDYEIDQIDDILINQYIHHELEHGNRLTGGPLCQNTVRKCVQILRNIFDYAAIKKHICAENNPMSLVGRIKMYPTREFSIYSPEEIEALIKVARPKWLGDMILLAYRTGIRKGDDDDKIRLNQRKPSKYKGLSRFGPEKNLQRINKFMKERPTFYKKLIQMKENFRFYLRCFYCITKVVILQFNSEKQDRISS